MCILLESLDKTSKMANSRISMSSFRTNEYISFKAIKFFRLNTTLMCEVIYCLHYLPTFCITLPTADILSGKNARAWVSMDFI